MIRLGTLLLCLVLGLAACSVGSSPQSASPSESAAPTAGATGSPAASASGAATSSPDRSNYPPTVMPPYTMARVAIATLPLYQERTVDSAVISELHRGDLVYLNGVAVDVDGHVWYDVWVGIQHWFDQATTGGAILGGDATTDYVSLLPATCPKGEPTFETVAVLTPWDRLTCFGNRELTLTAVVDTPCCNPPDGYVHKPYWLARGIDGVLGQMNIGQPIIIFHIDPATAVSPLARGQVVAMTGHFDDPAAATCSSTLDMSSGDNLLPPLVAEAQANGCRAEFVVTQYEVVDTQSMPPCCG